MRVAVVLALGAAFVSVTVAVPAHATPRDCSIYKEQYLQECLNETRPEPQAPPPASQIVQVQNPDDPTGAPMQMTRAEAAQIADEPPSDTYPNVWTLKPQQKLLDQLNQGAGKANNILCQGLPSVIRKQDCP
jgi:hypothetical protein